MANLIRFDPFAEIRALQRQFFNDDWFTSVPGQQLPATDVYVKDDKELIVEVHLPDFDEKDVNIDVDNGYLEIQAQKHEREEDKDKRYVVRESSSSFYRRIHLPEQADPSKIDARMQDGVLKVTVPLKKLPSPQKVTISGGKPRQSRSEKK